MGPYSPRQRKRQRPMIGAGLPALQSNSTGQAGIAAPQQRQAPLSPTLGTQSAGGIKEKQSSRFVGAGRGLGVSRNRKRRAEEAPLRAIRKGLDYARRAARQSREDGPGADAQAERYRAYSNYYGQNRLFNRHLDEAAENQTERYATPAPTPSIPAAELDEAAPTPFARRRRKYLPPLGYA